MGLKVKRIRIRIRIRIMSGSYGGADFQWTPAGERVRGHARRPLRVPIASRRSEKQGKMHHKGNYKRQVCGDKHAEHPAPQSLVRQSPVGRQVCSGADSGALLQTWTIDRGRETQKSNEP